MKTMTPKEKLKRIGTAQPTMNVPEPQAIKMDRPDTEHQEIQVETLKEEVKAEPS